jgi:hypothetical protein
MRFAGAAVIAGGDQHGRRRRQARLPQPALEGARGRDVLGGVEVEQFEADALGPPALPEAAQAQARLAHVQAGGAERAAAAVEVGREVVTGGQELPSCQQIANGADRQGQLLGDGQRAKAR